MEILKDLAVNGLGFTQEQFTRWVDHYVFDAVHRTDKNRCIIIRFSTRTIKFLWLDKAKELKNKEEFKKIHIKTDLAPGMVLVAKACREKAFQLRRDNPGKNVKISQNVFIIMDGVKKHYSEW